MSESSGSLWRRLGLLAAITVLTLTAMLWLRYGVMESGVLTAQCAGAAPAWWCGGRSALGWLIHYQVFGWAALLLGLLAWTTAGRRFAWLALVLSLTGLVLYNATLAAVGLVAALLRAARA